MEVVAVSRSLPQWLDIRGSRTFSSIVHEALTQPSDYIELTTSGIVGNKTAAHDGPVYGLFAEHYDYWSKELGVDRNFWNWCHWGENITFRCVNEKITEHDLKLGDIWAVGDDVQLQVCGARIPCFKLAWRCNQEDKWLKPLAESGFLGAYFRVIRGGRVYPGAKAILHEKSGEEISPAVISRLAFENDLKTRDTLNLLKDHLTLLKLNRWVMGRRLAALNDQANLGKNAWKGWRAFRTQRIVDEGGGVKSFYLSPNDGEPLAHYLPGQFLTVRLPNGKIRNWSISDWIANDDPNLYRLSIKRSTDASVWMHEHCTRDSVLEVRSPCGRFVLDRSQMVPARHMYASAGIGITPIVAMLKAHTAHANFEATPGIWIHVTQNARTFALEEDFASVDPERIKRVLFFTSPDDSDIKGIHYDHAGRPTQEIISQLLSEPYFINPLGISNIELEGRMSACYICGPTSFEEAMRAHFASIGVPPPFVRSETFDSTKAVADVDLDTAKVRFAKSGRQGTWVKKDAQTLLELAESLGLTPDFGCRAGHCESCKVRLLKGNVTGGMQLDGGVLLCSAQPGSAEVEVDA